VLLAICAFSLSLVGTFLVRSGVLTSVHAFATDPRRGVFILGYLVLVIGGSLTLYAIRAPKVGLGGRFELVSRESALLANNVLLLAAAGSVLLGTLYPLFLDALNLGKISVGPPYFDSVFVPLMTPLVFLMGVGPLTRWKQASIPDLAKRLRWAAAVGVVTALLLPLATGEWKLGVAFGLLLALWLVAATITGVVERVRGVHGVVAKLRRQPLSYWAMVVAHLGIAAFVVGVTMVKGYEVERDVKMNIGDTVAVGGYVFRFDGVSDVRGPNYRAARGTIAVSRRGTVVETLHPEKRSYNAGGQPMTNAAIDSGPFGDLYVSMGEPVGDGAWSIRVYSKPFITWVWGGFIMMAIGGFLAVSDRRYRAAAQRDTVPARAVTAGD
jgi:cytochrome c-type biogenesis protein CcmF